MKVFIDVKMFKKGDHHHRAINEMSESRGECFRLHRCKERERERGG